MKPNNILYKEIAETVTGDEYEKFYSSMYYMRKIAEHYNGEQYIGRKTSNKYIKDWYVGLTDEEEPSTHKYNLWYLRRMAEFLDSSISNDLNENQCLRVISDNISSETSVKLQISSNTIIIDSSVTLTATVLDEHRQPITNAEVTFYDGETEIDTGTTDSSGATSITYTPTVTGSHTLTASYSEYTSKNVSLTVNKHTSQFVGVIINPSYVNVGDNYTVLGYLEIDGTVASGKTINIYNDDTIVGTATSQSNGAFRFDSDPLSSSGTLHIKAVFETDTKYTGSESYTQTITVGKKTPSLTINTPVITYEDEFSVTGVLKDGNIGITGATVKLEWSETGGQTQVVEGTTGNGGAVTFSRSAPTTITNYTFKLVYDGNNKYNSKDSSTINVGVGKETTVMTLNSPVSGAVMYADGSMNVRGELVDNDSTPHPVANARVVAKLGNAVVGSYTTNNNGVFSGVLKGESLDIGYNTVDFVFEETAEYLGSSQTGLSIRVIEGESLTLSASPDILSYADSTVANPQVATFTAIHSGGAGKTVELYDASDDSLVATMTDAGNGIYTYDYASQGVGDIEYYAKSGSLLTKTFVVSDRLLYDTTEYSRTGTGSATSVATNNKTWDNTIDWELTADIKVTGMGCRIDVVPPAQSLNYHLGIGRSAYEQGSPVATYVGKNGGGEVSENHTTMEHNVYHTVKIVKEGTTVKFYFNGTLLRTDTTYAKDWLGNYDTESVKFTTWRTNTIYMRNLSVMPL